ncbi:MAG: NAD-dependent DNA ligase LigA [Lachnospiraceae bacterium]|jgi:DNA ligase (NAD+)|nr:NAD-dependent DNA ligase LigA [Lachnospiraceae bacterium]
MTDATHLTRQKHLTALLSAAARAYYAEDRELMSNNEYDRLYDELEGLEKITGVILAGSPTQQVGYEAVAELAKERHPAPMLSLAKTKSGEELAAWLGEQKGVLSWKLDGLTVVLTYTDGKLAKALTRGNGETGEVVTGNARVFTDLPLAIPFRGELVLRGEAVIGYRDFAEINAALPETEERYKNPRNLCSGSVRQLNNANTAARRVRFYAFALVQAEGKAFTYRHEQYEFLAEQGFAVVEYTQIDQNNITSVIEQYAARVKDYDIPSDGLVAAYDDIAYGEALGATAKTPRDALAFKWQDEEAETTLLEIEWSPSRTGLINPVAIFAPVELEGTTVSRASVHNISILQALKLGLGDRITVYKANMIIPQIAENLSQTDSVEIPATCPACGGQTVIQSEGGVQSLYCPNPDCPVKMLKSFALLASREGLNVEGLSEATLEKLIGRGFIATYADLFQLERHRAEIIIMEGFGEKSFANLQKSLEAARQTTLPRLLYGLGIMGIGAANARMLSRAFGHSLERLRGATAEEYAAIEGIGPVLAAAIRAYFDDEKNNIWLDMLLHELSVVGAQFIAPAPGDASTVGAVGNRPPALDGLVFVITGSLAHYANRSDLTAAIEERGGKVTGSVTNKTTALINNDAASSSTKNKTARALGVPVLTEAEFIAKYM